jgi:heme-degrading monooxygenase HmoA
MSGVGQPYSSGRWLVHEGREDEFIERWTEFIEWSLENAPGAQDFVLLRQGEHPRLFLSVGGWSDPDSMAAWQSHPEFAAKLGRCRELCDEFESGGYAVAAAPHRV